MCPFKLVWVTSAILEVKSSVSEILQQKGRLILINTIVGVGDFDTMLSDCDETLKTCIVTCVNRNKIK